MSGSLLGYQDYPLNASFYNILPTNAQENTTISNEMNIIRNEALFLANNGSIVVAVANDGPEHVHDSSSVHQQNMGIDAIHVDTTTHTHNPVHTLNQDAQAHPIVTHAVYH
tara:strand:+ start:1718 stop:2050 length:333 start_codon:yes stop_codon:yes gene_type:complete